GAPGPGGGEPKGKRARPATTASVRKLKRKGGGSSAPAPAAAAEASRRPPGERCDDVGGGVTVEDADALDCRVCFLPLKAPSSRCDVGHVVCSPCSDKLKATGKCHVCGVATGAYRRCYDMERLVDSIRVQCPYATYGCAERPAYHDRENHRLTCAHVPCYCPSEACSFVGSTEALLDHFSAVHSWPCITNAETNIFGVFTVRLHDGFNFLLADADCSTGNKKQGVTASVKCLLLLTVAREPHARIISVHWINPRPAVASSSLGRNSSEMQCKLSYSPYLFANNQSGGNQLINHSQTSTFRVACTDLSNGLPKPDDCFQFVVPNSVIGDHDKDSIMVGVRIIK
ncbi:hypothetical protein BS78_K165400, partial [Paspalum vaginatum]